MQTPVGTTIYHSGIDLAAESGDDILAAIDGKVTAVGYDNDKGYYVVIANDAGFEVEYNHCKDVYVESGNTVEAGQVVASVGSTGSATGAHLHFEVREDGFIRPEAVLWIRNQLKYSAGQFHLKLSGFVSRVKISRKLCT